MQLYKEYAELWKIRYWKYGALVGVISTVASYFINFYAGLFATERAGAALHDIFLDAIPKIDTSFLHLGASYAIPILVLVSIVLLPRYMPAVLIGASFVFVIRALFINMTNLGLYFDAGRISSSYTTFGGDLFFSGHVAIPVMLGFIFWGIPSLRYGFFLLAVILGAAAMAGHYHYSIDVFAAPFIAYGLYRLLYTTFPRLFELTER